MVTYELGWELTPAKYRGAPQAYLAAAKGYAFTWCDLNGVTPHSITVVPVYDIAKVVVLTTIEGEKDRPEQLSIKEPSPVLPTDYPDEIVDEPAIAPSTEESSQYNWVYVRDLKPGDYVAAPRRPLGTVKDVLLDPQTGRFLLEIKETGESLVYSKNDRVRKQVT